MNSAWLLLLCLALFGGGAAGVAVLTGERWARCLPTALLTAMVPVYLLGCLNQLRAGWWVATALLAVLGLVAVAAAIRTRRVAFPPAVAIFGFLTTAGFIVTQGLRFTGWDEFSHWGRVIRVAVEFQTLSVHSPVEIMFGGYAPGPGLLPYYVGALRPGTGLVEADAFRGMGLFVLSLVVPGFAWLTWRRWGLLLGAVVTAVLAPMVFYLPWVEVTADAPLGLLFGYALFVAITRTGRRQLLHLAPALFFLPLMKDSGTFLGIVVLVVAGLGARWRRLRPAPGVVARPAAGRFPLWLRALTGWLIECAIFAAGLASWKITLAVLHRHAPWSGPVSLHDLMDTARRTGPAYRVTTTERFLGAFGSRALDGHLPWLNAPSWLAILLAAFGLLVWVGGRRLPRRPWSAITLALAAGFVLFAAGVLGVYLTKFTENEALGLASFERYVGTYTCGLVLLVALVAFHVSTYAAGRPVRLTSRATTAPHPGAGRASRLVSVAPVVAVVLGLAVAAPVDAALLEGYRYPVGTATKVRVPLTAFANQAKACGVRPGEGIWMMVQGTQGFEYFILQYEFMRNHFAGWSVGPHPADDLWTRDLSPQEFAAELRRADVLLIYKSSPAMVQKYAALFPDPAAVTSGSMFRVVKQGADGVRLAPFCTQG